MIKYDYTIVSSDTNAGLEKEVIRVLNMGYRLAGGVSVTVAENHYIEFFQALIKEYETDSE